jgi:DNA-binding transcriptional MocR family regulator
MGTIYFMKKRPLYMNIAASLENQIRNEVLKTGDKLPSLRTLCGEYGVSMNTATQAYLELEARGMIESKPQSGFFVNASHGKKLPIPAVSRPNTSVPSLDTGALIDRVYHSLNDPSIVRLSLGVPDNGLLPIAKLNKGMVEALRSLPGSGTAYEDIQGNLKLRRAVARWSFPWGGNLTEGDLVTTSGAMNAISYCMMAIAQRGDTIAVESPVYFGILQLAKSLGLKVLEVPTHPVTGIDPDALKKVLPKIKLCLLISNFSNPLGSCMPEENKMAVVRMLADKQLPLIEDDLYGDVHFGTSRPKPCKAFDHEGLVLWCGSVSKTLAPGYRVGWVAPGRFKEQVLRLKMAHSVSSTTITQEVIANFLEKGRYELHLRKMRRTLHHNSLQFIRTIGDHFPDNTKVSRPQGGFMLWLELDKKVDTTLLYNAAMQHNISIAPGKMFSLQDQFNNCIRLSYGSQWNDGMETALWKLGQLAKKM